MTKFKGTSAKEFLLLSSPNEKYGLRAELQKHRLRGVVETEMEAYAKLRLKESKAPEMLEMLEYIEHKLRNGYNIMSSDHTRISQLIKQATEL